MESTLLVEQQHDSIRAIEQLASRDAAQRSEAERAVLHGDESTISALLDVLARENKKKGKRFIFGAIIAALLTVLLEVGVGLAFHSRLHIMQPIVPLYLAIGAALAPTRLQKAAARALARYDDVR